jgi:succinate dehydrogenase / fumarate reductase flavoprotein subunit
VRALRDRNTRVRLSYRGKKCNLDLWRALELEHKLELAEAIALGAQRRTESRGSHFRSDHPERRDAEWLHHTLAWRQPDGSVSLERSEVRLGRYAPEERKY